MSQTEDNAKLVVFENCFGSGERLERWKKQKYAKLNKICGAGCAINVLLFLGIITPQEQHDLIENLPKNGTDFTTIINYIEYQENQHQPAGHPPIHYFQKKIPVGNAEQIDHFINILETTMPPNSCTIVKFNMIHNKTHIGHTAIFSKDADGTVWWIDPFYDKSRIHNAKLFLKYLQHHAFETASLVFTTDNPDTILPDSPGDKILPDSPAFSEIKSDGEGDRSSDGDRTLEDYQIEKLGKLGKQGDLDLSMLSSKKSNYKHNEDANVDDYNRSGSIKDVSMKKRYSDFDVDVGNFNLDTSDSSKGGRRSKSMRFEKTRRVRNRKTKKRTSRHHIRHSRRRCKRG
jgi:hypothetical protein